MSNVVISKKEYNNLKKQANAYKKIAGKLFEFIIKDPINEIVSDFRKTNLYTEDFLIDFEKGLRKSSYIKKN